MHVAFVHNLRVLQGFARLLYHGPEFGVLDECTSAVSVDAEEKLYKAAIDLGVSCVTVSQRLTLPEFHSQELRLGENCRSGWSLHPVDPLAHNTLASAT
jgi:ABC-type uncharacterized transport system fused permease/ATPase subunit